MEWTCSWEGLFCLFQPLKGSQSALAAKCVVNMMNCCPLQKSGTIKSPYGENSVRQKEYNGHRNYYLCNGFYITSTWSAAAAELDKIKSKYLVNSKGSTLMVFACKSVRVSYISPQWLSCIIYNIEKKLILWGCLGLYLRDFVYLLYVYQDKYVFTHSLPSVCVCTCVHSNTCRSFIRNNKNSFICSFSSSNTLASRLKR